MPHILCCVSSSEAAGGPGGFLKIIPTRLRRKSLIEVWGMIMIKATSSTLIEGQFMQGQQTTISDYFFLPQEHVLFGIGSLDKLADEVKRLGGQRALVITGQSLASKT